MCKKSIFAISVVLVLGLAGNASAGNIPSNPSPADGATGVPLDVCLSWLPGNLAFQHVVWFDEDFNNVNDADPLVDSPLVPPGRGFYSIGSEEYCPENPMPGAVPVTLELGTTYYWRIDEIRLFAPPERGNVWSFTTIGSTAHSPRPADGAEYVSIDAVLSWGAGFDALSHDVYFGTNYNDVNDANTSLPEYMGNQDANSYDPPEDLELDTTYYWRIDEVNGPNTWKGDVWSFTTGIAPQGETIIVTSTADSGPGTLRQALLDAQNGDTITFDPAVFPPSAPVTISVTSELPYIHQGNLTIDGSNSGVILDGTNATGTWVAGLQIVSSDASTIRGLQVSNFSGTGIAISGDAKYNMIGGNRAVGTAPLGQGNLISRNENVGIGLGDSSFNTIRGNYIGTDPSGTEAWGNRYEGIFIDGGNHNQIIDNLISDNGASGVSLHGSKSSNNIISGNYIGTDASKENPLSNHNSGIFIRQGASYNRVGPDNVIAYNNWSGVEVYSPDSLGNIITQNTIHDNGWLGIDLWGGGNMELASPIIFDFNVNTGSVTGLAYPNGTVELFSTSSDEGEIYEGQTTADGAGTFTFNKGFSFAGPHLTATVTDTDGNTSEFSLPTVGTSGSLVLQEDNSLPKTRLTSRQSGDLDDNRIASHWQGLWAYSPLSELLNETLYLGVKRYRLSINNGDWDKVDWSKPEFSVDPSHDEFVTGLASNGIRLTYFLTFWDKATWPGGVGAPCPRFKTEEEIQRYLEFVRFIVGHFKDRIQTYEIWNEPDNTGCPQWIEVEDYINLVRRVVPVIRQEYPEAKIQVGGTTGLSNPDSRAYLFAILESDIMPLVDVISWHPFYNESPESNPEYYAAYPALVRNIMDVASAHGFDGEYKADESSWQSYSEPVCAKYYGRGVVMHLGMDVTAGNLRIAHDYAASSFTVRNLSTLMAGAEPISLPLTIQTAATNVRSYTFSLPNDDHLIALWTDGIAVEYDPGVSANLAFPNLSAQRVIGIDVLYGFEQELIAETENGKLAIRNLLVKDYPIIIRFTNTPPVACIVGGDRMVEAGSDCEARVVLDGTCSSDEDSTPGTNDDIEYFDWYEIIDPCDANSDILLGSGEVIECNLPLGENDIILEVIDKAGAFDINEVTITVEDVTPPVIDCPADITLYAHRPNGAIATFTVTATDLCDTAPEVICDPCSGSMFLCGTTEVVCTAVDSSGNSASCSFTVTVIEPIESAMKFTPQTLNCKSKGNWVKAHFVLPEGFMVEDVNTNSPAKITEPFEPDIESSYIDVFVNEAGLVEVEAAFSRADFCGSATTDETTDVMVIGVLTSGQNFYGTDTIKIVLNNMEFLAGLASRWLEAGCHKPDWCGGLDVDRDSAVNFVDFAMSDTCCIEVIKD